MDNYSGNKEYNIYRDIRNRTNGEIYLGIVGPVRTGKSTFIKRFMETMVLPNITDEYRRERARDELPQSGSGRTVMTAEPRRVLSSVSLVDDADLSEHIVIREFAAQIAETCDDELYTLNRRVAALLGQDEVLAQLVQAWQRFNLPATLAALEVDINNRAELDRVIAHTLRPGESIHYLPVTLTPEVLRAAFEKVEYFSR